MYMKTAGMGQALTPAQLTAFNSTGALSANPQNVFNPTPFYLGIAGSFAVMLLAPGGAKVLGGMSLAGILLYEMLAKGWGDQSIFSYTAAA